ncbi:anhydro-N-acetylmuramic acid kinase, partial [Halomonas elongata]|uniref:anhydro-N-acetylmuramic acid kinase n=1 Tax=Halomonas elongata TaxID=2746 RepID=UPI00255ADF1B
MSLFIGLMSGTSLDGIDAALVDIAPDTPPRLLATHGEPIPPDQRDLLWRLCHAERISFAELARAEADFSRLQAGAVDTLLAKQNLPASRIVAIGSHGQTVEHA